MWMVKCNDHCKELKTISIDSIFGRKLRPLMPKAPISSNITMSGKLSSIPPTPPCCIHNPNSNILTWNQPSSGLSDYGVKKEISTLPLVSSRWNPTPEQLQALEEMYRRGIRTPSAEQIKQIAVKLRRFGKIEGKNVFYWFQNHKARERQKKRRQLELIGAGKNMHFVESQERKQTGLSRRYMQTEHTKKLLSPSNCSTPLQGSVSMHRAVVPECKTVGRTQLEQRELHLQQQQQQQQTTAKNDEICWQLDLSSCMSSNGSIIAQKNSRQENEKPFGALNLSISLASKNDDFKNFETGIQEHDQTLELFPIKNNDCKINIISGVEEDNYTIVSRSETKFRTNEFFEFLPTKN